MCGKHRSSNKCSTHVQRYRIVGFIQREMTVMVMLMVCFRTDWRENGRGLCCAVGCSGLVPVLMADLTYSL
jgi:hypothetical protein